MNETELRDSLKNEGEYYFSDDNKKYLLYLWQQCDGILLNLCREDSMYNQILWQTSGKSLSDCANEFIDLYRHNGLQNV